MSSPSSDSPKTPKRSPSPTTSTPGSTPEGGKNKGLKSSELLYSDESLVDISIEHPTTIETDSAMEVTLNEKSVDNASTQDIKEVSCETTEGKTSSQDEYNMASIAQGTNENLEEIRKHNLSQLLAEISLNSERSI